MSQALNWEWRIEVQLQRSRQVVLQSRCAGVVANLLGDHEEARWGSSWSLATLSPGYHAACGTTDFSIPRPLAQRYAVHRRERRANQDGIWLRPREGRILHHA